jgi:hypothetical protein
LRTQNAGEASRGPAGPRRGTRLGRWTPFDGFDELTAGGFDGLTAGGFDKLTAGGFDKLTAGGLRVR